MKVYKNLFLVSLYTPRIYKKIKSNPIIDIFNNEYKYIYKVKWCDIKYMDKNIIKNGKIILNKDLNLNIYVNLSFEDQNNKAVAFLRNREIMFISKTDKKTLNFRITDKFNKDDKIRILVLSNNNINFFNLGCSLHITGIFDDIERSCENTDDKIIKNETPQNIKSYFNFINYLKLNRSIIILCLFLYILYILYIKI